MCHTTELDSLPCMCHTTELDSLPCMCHTTELDSLPCMCHTTELDPSPACVMLQAVSSPSSTLCSCFSYCPVVWWLTIFAALRFWIIEGLDHVDVEYLMERILWLDEVEGRHGLPGDVLMLFCQIIIIIVQHKVHFVTGSVLYRFSVVLLLAIHHFISLQATLRGAS